MADSIEVTCPCCATRLVVDVATGEVLSLVRPPDDHEQSFDAAMDAVHKSADRREEAFSRAFKRTQNLDDLLQKKFDEARKKAEQEPDKKHRNPLDFD
ncbi:MAG TPA: hypothetical protein VD788_04030 [Candidatus Polarisedimenticolaceae bacterium]|nr:hypothetical protein [Candidatus Polarisedimenticolaceae bacterium]